MSLINVGVVSEFYYTYMTIHLLYLYDEQKRYFCEDLCSLNEFKVSCNCIINMHNSFVILNINQKIFFTRTTSNINE